MIIVVKQPGSYNLQQVKSVPLRALSSVKKILLSLNNLKVFMFFATFAVLKIVEDKAKRYLGNNRCLIDWLID